MEFLIFIVVLFGAVALAAWFFIGILRGIYELSKYFFGYTANPRRSRKRLSTPHSAILDKSFPFYQKLTQKGRSKFQKRLRYFIDSKQFIPKQMDRITDEMRVLIGACAVQLTFGLPPLRLMYFKQILIYPDKYTSANGNLHKGEVNPKYRLIVLSWKDFVEGYANPTNGYNVGLHEFAHALKVEDAIRNEEFDFFSTKMIHELHKEFQQKQSAIAAGNHPILRKYAGTNFDEFFAVCIEYFFERPQELYEAEGGIYTILRFMLKQSPKDY